MVSARSCSFDHPDGRACGAPPLKGGRFCYWHAPEKSEEATEARRLGGLRRRREKTIASAYDLAGLGSIQSIRRVLEIAGLDTLGLDNSVQRTRALVSVALAATKLLEVEELASFGLDPHDE
jgi:hypothetical protein